MFKINFKNLDKYTFRKINKICLEVTEHRLMEIKKNGFLVLIKNKGIFSRSIIKNLTLSELLLEKCTREISISKWGNEDFTDFVTNEALNCTEQGGLSGYKDIVNYLYDELFDVNVNVNRVSTESHKKEDVEDFREEPEVQPFGEFLGGIVEFFFVKKSIMLRKAQIGMGALLLSTMLNVKQLNSDKITSKTPKGVYLGIQRVSLYGKFSELFHNTS